MKPTSYVADFDSAAAMLRALANYLHGRDVPLLGAMPEWRALNMKLVASVVNRMPNPIKEQVHIWSGRYEAIRARRLPWLPQTFLIPLQRDECDTRFHRQKNAQALARLGVGIRRCLKCPLHESRKHAVPGEGNPRAPILLIGEAPGAFEDKHGRPFCGRAGQFLDGLLDRCALKRSDVFITNSVKCRPPNNRPPRSKELHTCYEHWLQRQIDIIDPKIIVLFGNIPVRQLLHVNRSLKELHGQFYQKGDRLYQIHYHPAAGMRFPNLGAAMARDFEKLCRFSHRPKLRGRHKNN